MLLMQNQTGATYHMNRVCTHWAGKKMWIIKNVDNKKIDYMFTKFTATFELVLLPICRSQFEYHKEKPKPFIYKLIT